MVTAFETALPIEACPCAPKIRTRHFLRKLESAPFPCRANPLCPTAARCETIRVRAGWPRGLTGSPRWLPARFPQRRQVEMRRVFFLTILMCGGSSLFALDNGLARTPPMGWNSWNKFACNVSESLIRDAADAIVSTGMKDAGYQYVVIDHCWQVSRDAEGNIVPDAKRFPGGMKALADYIHSKGLKFGIYSDAGTGTCQNRPGGRGYEFQDARQYAAWGVDYLKYDWCNTTTQNSVASYSIMRDALAKSGRPIVFSICEWGSSKPWLWAKDVGNLWRSTGDIQDKWDIEMKWGGHGVVQILDLQDGMQLWLWSLNHLQKATDADGGKLYQGARQGVTFPLADALCWLLASRCQILDLLELEKQGPEVPTVA